MSDLCSAVPPGWSDSSLGAKMCVPTSVHSHRHVCTDMRTVMGIGTYTDLRTCVWAVHACACMRACA